MEQKKMVKHKVKALVLALSVASPMVAYAQTYDFKACVNTALNQNPEMEASASRIDQAQGALNKAESSRLPQITLSVTGTNSDNALNVFGMKLQQRQATFNDFGFGDTTDPSVIIPEQDPTEEQELLVDPTERLRQLTTKPVVGFTHVTPTGASTTQIVKYIEAGTGHIFSIDLETETEERVSATTIPLASHGVITPNGEHVLMQSDTGARASFIIGTLNANSDRMSNFPLEEDVVSFTATVENQLLYATPAGNELLVKAYTPRTGNTQTLFTVPFRNASISWHHSTAGPHTVYPKATSQLEGYVYTYTNGVVDRVAASGYGLSAVGSDVATIYSTQTDGDYQSFHVAKGELGSTQTPITFVSEKCQFTHINTFVALCGGSFTEHSHQMPDDWFKGSVVLNDSIWEYNTARQSARLLISPERATGRQVDMINPKMSANDTNLYFQNKVDQTLWVYHYILSSN